MLDWAGGYWSPSATATDEQAMRGKKRDVTRDMSNCSNTVVLVSALGVRRLAEDCDSSTFRAQKARYFRVTKCGPRDSDNSRKQTLSIHTDCLYGVTQKRHSTKQGSRTQQSQPVMGRVLHEFQQTYHRKPVLTYRG